MSFFSQQKKILQQQKFEIEGAGAAQLVIYVGWRAYKFLPGLSKEVFICIFLQIYSKFTQPVYFVAPLTLHTYLKSDTEKNQMFDLVE